MMWILIILAGLVALYSPAYYELITGVWVTDEQGHGPIVLLIVLFLFYTKLKEMPIVKTKGIQNFTGWSFLVIGLFAYALGSSQAILEIYMMSQFLVVLGMVLIFYGFYGAKALWFPLLFMLFLIPIPGAILTAITLPMKIAVSYVAEWILFSFDYPIARSGVIIQIGYYKLLVADACAGVHTVISLEAMGLLYLYLVKSQSLIRNVSLAILILPISFIANVIRVIILILVTYYFGDEVGQGFIHNFAGFVLFGVALFIIILVDSILIKIGAYFDKRKAAKSE